jgi:hypothetical protein
LHFFLPQFLNLLFFVKFEVKLFSFLKQIVLVLDLLFMNLLLFLDRVHSLMDVCFGFQIFDLGKLFAQLNLLFIDLANFVDSLIFENYVGVLESLKDLLVSHFLNFS